MNNRLNRYLFDATIPAFTPNPHDARNAVIEWQGWTIEKSRLAWIDHVVGDGTYDIPDELNTVTYSFPDNAFLVPVVVAALATNEQHAHELASHVWAGADVEATAYHVFPSFAPAPECVCKEPTP
jgi:hypothetical protein